MIIGLTGTNCAGKDTVAEYLVGKKGFRHFSLSDVIRDELKRKKMEPIRENLIKAGMGLRARYGNTVLAKRTLAKCSKDTDYIITSIRHPAEVRELKKEDGFFLVNVDAPDRMRFERMLKRKRPGDPQSFAKFKEYEKREMQVSGPGQQMGKTIALADFVITNSGQDLNKLYKKIDLFLAKRGYSEYEKK